VIYKQCVTCDDLKPVGEFYPRPDSRDRLQSRCKACTKVSRRESERRNMNTTVRIRCARRRASKLAQTPEWCRTDEAAEAIRNIYSLADTLSEITGYKFVVDHVVPLAKGGEHRPDNLQPLRQDHNAAKRDRLDWVAPPPVFRKVTVRRPSEEP